MPPPHCFLFFFFLLHLASSHSCSSSSSSTLPCPPFTSSHPPFPFSSSPGCGHPSFQIKCSTLHSLISINNLSFSLLHYDPNSSSLLLSPLLSSNSSDSSNPTNCSSSPNLHFIPNHSINLSGSPFTISDASCSRLSFLQPCKPLTLPNCNLCPWECKLIKNPSFLLQDCGSVHHSVSDSDPRCQKDVLGYLDNILSLGIEVEWDESQDPYFSSCRDCRSKNGVCGFNSTDPTNRFICIFSESSISPAWIQRVKLKPNRVAILSLGIAFGSVLILVFVAFAVFRSRQRFKSSSIEEDPTILFLHNNRSSSLLLPPVFTFEELESSTNGFDPKRKIGDGGFGSVYLGQLSDGRTVAVKYLHGGGNGGQAFSTKSFCNEILILSSIDHQNLVKLHGYCSDPRGLLLVYDYVPNGTLADHLHGRKGCCLSWQVRLDIALQTALAMEYLHFSVVPPIVHRDITSSNIFVEKDMRIKVGDFGLSRLLVLQDTNTTSSAAASTGFVWTGPQGTPGYLDPDYHRSFRLTEKSDVYSFGVVLLELVSGLKAVDQSRDKREIALADLVVSRIHTGQLNQVVDPVLTTEVAAAESVAAVAELAFRCVAAEKDDRPDSREVVEELNRVRSRVVKSDLGDDDVARKCEGL